jgi:hypothetical protein
VSLMVTSLMPTNSHSCVIRGLAVTPNPALHGHTCMRTCACVWGGGDREKKTVRVWQSGQFEQWNKVHFLTGGKVFEAAEDVSLIVTSLVPTNLHNCVMRGLAVTPIPCHAKPHLHANLRAAATSLFSSSHSDAASSLLSPPSKATINPFSLRFLKATNGTP